MIALLCHRIFEIPSYHCTDAPVAGCCNLWMGKNANATVYSLSVFFFFNFSRDRNRGNRIKNQRKKKKRNMQRHYTQSPRCDTLCDTRAHSTYLWFIIIFEYHVKRHVSCARTFWCVMVWVCGIIKKGRMLQQNTSIRIGHTQRRVKGKKEMKIKWFTAAVNIHHMRNK